MTSMERLRKSFPDLLVALDFDGPIALIVERPDDSRSVSAAAPMLNRLADQGIHVAIVTGRGVETLLRLSGLRDVLGLQVLGIHGAQRWTNGVLTQIEAPPSVQTLRDALPGLVSGIDEKMWVEDKGLSLVVHARRSEDPERAIVQLRSAVVASNQFPDIDIHDGKLILEFRVPSIDKGGTLETLLAELDPGAALSSRATISETCPGSPRCGHGQSAPAEEPST